jgi:HNH endonuclease
MKTILLENKGILVLVDDSDFEFLNQWKWRASSEGYAVRSIGNSRRKPRPEIKMHRLLVGARAGQIIDHVNRNKLDNRRANLRFATNRLNCLNTDKSGVSWHKRGKAWQVRFGKETDQYFGLFRDRNLAHAVAKFLRASLIYNELPV